MEEIYKQMLGEEWFYYLKPYLLSKEFLELGKFINKRRTEITVYPDKDEIFKAFKATPYNQVKAVVLGLDPYSDSTACGLSFCCCKKLKPNKSLKYILEEIQLEYPDSFYNILNDRMDLLDLQRWANQGILMLNSALTVEKGSAKSHLSKWENFTIEVIKSINKKDYVVWLLLGNDAQKFEKYISTKHGVVAHIHPAALAYNPNAKWFNSGIFKEVNERLKFNNLKEVEW